MLRSGGRRCGGWGRRRRGGWRRRAGRGCGVSGWFRGGRRSGRSGRGGSCCVPGVVGVAGGEVGAQVVVGCAVGGAAEAAARVERGRVVAEGLASGPVVLEEGALVGGVFAGGDPGEEGGGVDEGGGGQPVAGVGEVGGCGG